MKLNKLKVLTAIILTSIIASNSIVTFCASNIQIDTEVINFESEVTGFDVTEEQLAEEKQICNASIEDDFEDDAVLVMFDNSTSLKCNEFTTNDFPSVNATSIEYPVINRAFGRKIRDHLDNKISTQPNITNVSSEIDDSSDIDISDESVTFSDVYEMIGTVDDEDIQEYNQLIKINLNIHSKQNVLDTIKILEERDDVLIVQPNYYYEQCAIPNDTYISKQSDIIDLLDLEETWNITTGSADVRVGVMDTGIKRVHSDLTANVNDDIKYAYGDLDALVDTNGHGTQVAGIIGAVGNNNRGVAGVCWDVDLISLKIIGDNDVISDFAIYQAFDYAKLNSIEIVNCSFGSYSYDNYLYEAISDFDGLVVCAAGNDSNNNDNNHYYPSDYNLDNIISVANTDNNDELYNSNYGVTSVDLAAPGVNIYTTYNGDISSEYYTDDFYGTSLSAPFVSGVAALIKSIYPTMTANGVKKAILDGVDKCSSLNGKVKTGGRLNAYNSIKSAQEHKFTVVYNKNGGTGTAMSNTTVTYGVPTKLSANTYSASTQYTSFAGWYAHRASDNKWLYTNGTSSGWYVEGLEPSGYQKALYKNQATISATTCAKNDVVTMYAQWRPYQYKITYYNDTQCSSNSQIVSYNKSINLLSDVFIKTGYKFKGWTAKRKSDSKEYYTNGSQYAWYTDGTQPDDYEKYIFTNTETVTGLSNVDNDVIYMYAQWTPLSYTIQFDRNGPKTGSMDEIIADSSQTFTLPSCTFIWSGYCFNGWNLVDEDDFWYYTDGTQYEWYIEGSEPSGYKKVIYQNKDTFSYLADYEGITVTLVVNWMPTYLIKTGDVDLDGVLSISDATLIQKYLADTVEFNDVQLYAADVNKDGTVSIQDATDLQKLIL